MTNTSFWASLGQALTNPDYGSTDSSESLFEDPYWGVPIDGYVDSYADSYVDRGSFDEWMSPEPLLRDETDYGQIAFDYLDQSLEEIDDHLGSDWAIPTMDYEREVLPEHLREFATTQGHLSVLEQFDWDADLQPGQPMRDVA